MLWLINVLITGFTLWLYDDDPTRWDTARGYHRTLNWAKLIDVIFTVFFLSTLGS